MATENVYTFARDDVVKNVPTNTPAILRRFLASYMKSIGQISCGSIQATCWLVTDMLVITNYHVYVLINTERDELQNVNLPITVTFDFFYSGQTEHVVTVEVDEERDPHLENPHLDYKFLRLKENDGLRDRVRLGPIVRCRSVQEGLVIIIGYPAKKEMHEETCVVHSRHSWLRTLQERHCAYGVHMSSTEVWVCAYRYEHLLPYDTNLFIGSSGSPVFDLKGNIVAMHTHGYSLNAECSLMEFGVQFSAICEDMRHRYVNVVEQLFPEFDDEPMDIDEDTHNDTHQTLPNTSDVAQLQHTQHENVHNDDQIDETRNSTEQLLNDTNSSAGAPVQNTQHESVVNVDHLDINNENISEETISETISAERLSVLGSSFQNEESPESWAWEKKSKTHREKFVKLHEYGRNHPQQIKEVNDVRFCCSNEFLVGRGSDATRVYVGLSKDGYERAVKRFPNDDDRSTSLADQEKKILNEQNAVKSNHVVKYRFLDKSGNDWLYLIMDLYEESLEEFVKLSNLDDSSKIVRDIIQQVLKGIADIHRDPRCILHRDLKPTNILRDIDDSWVLADFGISRILTPDVSTFRSKERGTDDWKAVESCSSNGVSDDGEVRYKKKSDIQVTGMVAFYTATNGKHPFGEKRYLLDNLLNGKPVGLDTLKHPGLKDLITWMLSHDPKDRPSAEEALKHPYLQSPKQKFEMLCKMGNQPEIKTQDVKSDVVRRLNSDPEDWRNLMTDILKYLSIDSLKGKTLRYKSSWTDCLRLIRNVNQHWHDRPRPRPVAFYDVGDPQEYFLNLFPNLPVVVHAIVRSCDWKERPDFKEYFS